MAERRETNMTTEELQALAEQVGFEHSGELNMDALVFREDVRAMCNPKQCRAYGHTWSCPPAAGTLEEARSKAARYHRGIIVQTTAKLRHDLDGRGMLDAEKVHKKRFETLVRQIRYTYPQCLPMGAGACTRCKKCTYPDRPCRYPERKFTSMEGYGLMVSDVCRGSGLSYDYGQLTITYVSCILID